RVAVVASDTLLKFFFGAMLDELRDNGASRVHPSLFHPIARRKDGNPAPFQFKSFLLRPRVIGLSSISEADRSNFSRTVVKRICLPSHWLRYLPVRLLA